MAKTSDEKLVSSINESAQHIGAVTLTFLAVCVYIGIAIASTTDELLLLGKSIPLPLFDVQIPLDKFYVLAPALLTFLHLHLLLLEYLLVSKVVRLCQGDNPPDEESDLFSLLCLSASCLVKSTLEWCVSSSGCFWPSLRPSCRSGF